MAAHVLPQVLCWSPREVSVDYCQYSGHGSSTPKDFSQSGSKQKICWDTLDMLGPKSVHKKYIYCTGLACLSGYVILNSGFSHCHGSIFSTPETFLRKKDHKICFNRYFPVIWLYMWQMWSLKLKAVEFYFCEV